MASLPGDADAGSKRAASAAFWTSSRTKFERIGSALSTYRTGGNHVIELNPVQGVLSVQMSATHEGHRREELKSVVAITRARMSATTSRNWSNCRLHAPPALARSDRRSVRGAFWTKRGLKVRNVRRRIVFERHAAGPCRSRRSCGHGRDRHITTSLAPGGTLLDRAVPLHLLTGARAPGGCSDPGGGPGAGRPTGRGRTGTGGGQDRGPTGRGGDRTGGTGPGRQDGGRQGR